MKTQTIILIAAGVALPVAGFAYYQHVKSKYDFEFQGVNVTSITGGNIELSVRFLITNQTGVRVTIFDSKFLIYANGAQIGVATQGAPLVVPTNMITTMEAKVVVDKGRIDSALFDFLFAKISGHSANIELVIQGPVKLKVDAPLVSWITVTVPVDEIYNL